jgi:cell division inhibitor SepF
MSFLQRAKEMLGLADEYYDDEYDDYYDEEDDEYEDEAEAPSRSVYSSPYSHAPRSVRRLEREPDVDRARHAGAPQVQMHIVEPRSYGEAQSIADKYRLGTPVIMNLSLTDPDLSKRLIDFASGLTYGLDGGLQKVSDRVFMLTPANVDVSDAQRRDLRERGLFSLDG